MTKGSMFSIGDIVRIRNGLEPDATEDSNFKCGDEAEIEDVIEVSWAAKRGGFKYTLKDDSADWFYYEDELEFPYDPVDMSGIEALI